MATGVVSDLGNILKQQYTGSIVSQINDKDLNFQRMSKKTDIITVDGLGLAVQMSVKYQNNPGRLSIAENGTLPTAGVPLWAKPTVGLKFAYGRFALTGQAIKAAKRNSAGFATSVGQFIESTTAGIKKDREVWLMGRGSGALCKVTQGSGSITAGDWITVDNAAALERGMVISDFSTNASSGGSTGSIGTDTVIAEVDMINNKITLTSTETVTVNYFLYRTGERGNVAMGLEGIYDGIDSAGNRLMTALQGVTRSSNTWWDGNIIDNGGTNRDLSEDQINACIQAIHKKTGGMANTMNSGFGVLNAFHSLARQDRRYSDLNFNVGFQTLKYSYGNVTLELITSQYCPPNALAIYDSKHLYLAQTDDGIGFMDLDGNRFNRIADKDAYEVTEYVYYDVVTDLAASGGWVRNISEV